MAQTDTSHHGTTGWVGWVYFGGFMMLLAGLFQAIAGITALVKDNVYVVGNSGLLVFNYTQWGWIHLIIGIILFFTAFSVFAGGLWGRIVGSIVAGISALSNFAFVVAYPVWTTVMIVLDVLVIYALLVHGDEVQEE